MSASASSVAMFSALVTVTAGEGAPAFRSGQMARARATDRAVPT